MVALFHEEKWFLAKLVRELVKMTQKLEFLGKQRGKANLPWTKTHKAELKNTLL